jgi:hypothetical protein
MTRKPPQEKARTTDTRNALARIAKSNTGVDINALPELIAGERELRLSKQEQQRANKAVRTRAAKINVAWQKAVSSIIETGKLLIECKEGKKKLPHGDFLKLFDPQIGNLAFSDNVAQQLMKIARHPILSNPVHGQVLPPSWRTLVVLSRAPTTKLEVWLKDGTINAEMERATAEALISPQVEAEVLANPPASHPDRTTPLSPNDDASDDDAPAADAVRKVTVRGHRKKEALQKLTELPEPKMAKAYTDLIKKRKLLEGDCDLPWPQYFEYRDAHPDECTPLTNDDLAYVWQWTHAGPAPSSDADADAPASKFPNLIAAVEAREKHKSVEADADADDSDADASDDDADADASDVRNPSHVAVRQCLRHLHELLFDSDSKIDWAEVINIVGSKMIRDIVEELARRSGFDRIEAREKTTLN